MSNRLKTPIYVAVAGALALNAACKSDQTKVEVAAPSVQAPSIDSNTQSIIDGVKKDPCGAIIQIAQNTAGIVKDNLAQTPVYTEKAESGVGVGLVTELNGITYFSVVSKIGGDVQVTTGIGYPSKAIEARTPLYIDSIEEDAYSIYITNSPDQTLELSTFIRDGHTFVSANSFDPESVNGTEKRIAPVTDCGQLENDHWGTVSEFKKMAEVIYDNAK